MGSVRSTIVHGLLCFPVYPQLLPQYWAYKRHSVNIYKMKQLLNGVTSFLPSLLLEIKAIPFLRLHLTL